MKHSAWDKLLLALMSLIIIGIGAIFIGIALHIADGEIVWNIIHYPADSLPWAVVAVIAGLGLLALSFRVTYAFLLTKGGERELESSVMIREGENGSLFISAEALRTMVRQYCKKRAMVKSCECGALLDDKNGALCIRLSIDPAADIAQEVSDIQEGLSEYLLSSCGLQIKNISVTIIPNNE